MLINVRYGTQDRNGMLMYYVPLRPGLFKTFGTQFDAFWCCTGTGSEEYAKLNDSIYFHDESSVYVNLFIPSRLDWKERGLQLRQTTRFPNEESHVQYSSWKLDRVVELGVLFRGRSSAAQKASNCVQGLERPDARDVVINAAVFVCRSGR